MPQVKGTFGQIADAVLPAWKSHETTELEKVQALLEMELGLHIYEFALHHKLDPQALLNAVRWKTSHSVYPQSVVEVKKLYNEVRAGKAPYFYPKTNAPESVPAWNAPMVRANKCYCLNCKRLVQPKCVRVVKNQCHGSCPRCGRKVCRFNAKQ